MAIDKRDVSLVNGGMEQGSASTKFETTFVDQGVTAEKVGKLQEVDSAIGETTWHEVRFDKDTGQFASIKWKRVLEFLFDFKEKSDAQFRDPSSDFNAGVSNAPADASKKNNACKVTVGVEVFAPGMTVDKSVVNDVVNIVITDVNKTWIKATLNPIA